MLRLLHYVAGVRLIVDPYDHHLWNFTVRSRRYHLRERGGTFVLRTDDETLLGTYNDWSRAIAAAKEYAHRAITEPLPVIAPRVNAPPASSRNVSTARVAPPPPR